MVRPGQRLGPGGGGGAPFFKEADAEAVADADRRHPRGGARGAQPACTVVANGRNWTTTVTGSTNDYFVTSNWTRARAAAPSPTTRWPRAPRCA